MDYSYFDIGAHTAKRLLDAQRHGFEWGVDDCLSLLTKLYPRDLLAYREEERPRMEEFWRDADKIKGTYSSARTYRQAMLKQFGQYLAPNIMQKYFTWHHHEEERRPGDFALFHYEHNEVGLEWGLSLVDPEMRAMGWSSTFGPLIITPISQVADTIIYFHVPLVGTTGPKQVGSA